MTTALITGCAGQDGSYLSEHLLDAGYEVHGIVRRNSVPEHQQSRLDEITNGEIVTHYGDVTDISSLYRIMREVQPDHVYNLAAQSHVRISFDVPEYTAQVNGVGVLNMLQVVRDTVPSARFYQASSSEIWGNQVDPDGFQRLTTPMHPVSPYGCAKLYGFHITRHFRRAYGMYAVNGVLMNHESPRRGSNFVTAKVAKTAVEIYRGRTDKLVMGNLDAQRDWGHSKDYTRAMHKMLLQESPHDYVIATGVTRSVRDLCDVVFRRLSMDYRDYVVQDEQYMRPEELHMLRGDASLARSILNWKPQYTFESMMQEIVGYWLERIS